MRSCNAGPAVRTQQAQGLVRTVEDLHDPEEAGDPQNVLDGRIGGEEDELPAKRRQFLGDDQYGPQSEARDAINAVHIDDDRAVAAFDIPDQV